MSKIESNTSPRPRRFRIPFREFKDQKKDASKEMHQLLDESELVRLHDLFQKEDGMRMNQSQLKEVLNTVAKIEYPDDVFEKEFLKMNSTW